ncbi:MAG: geranylgeranylglycerol-phosphate geranylgeranyltransferase [Bacteroidetes bacterium]|nr:geranylgeranylglycerol-phosphate geranylgeranyltransferase [Bacteroidota bacterium]
MNYLKLIRWTNLVIIALLMAIVRLFIFEKGLQNSGLLFNLQFPESSFWILVASVVLIAAGGNVVNDIYDQEIDSINKPDKKIVGKHISETMAWVLFFLFSLSGVGMGYYLALEANDTSFTLFHLFTPLLLWIYAAQLKKSPVIGNLAIAVLAACVPLVQLTFEYGSMLFTYHDILDIDVYGNPLLFMPEWGLYLAVFAFLSTLIRELIKDIEDVEGDKKYGARTLPVIIGIVDVKKVVVILSMFFIALLYLALFQLSIFSKNTIVYFAYQSLSIALLVGSAMLKLVKANDKKDFEMLSKLWKLIMLAGFGTCVIYGFL